MRRCWPAAPPYLFEGKPVGTPDPGTFWRVMRRISGVKLLFTAPTAIRAIKKEDPDGVFLKKYDSVEAAKRSILAGERCRPRHHRMV
jgi:acyl-coenzyme A synthetase/AMP-(fatty) acid ligase